ncbi:MAG: carbon-nitrogen hydrolase family protein, partial [Epsilonproteobacteria bacterium]|nr:carbon-nitrogen hydrolase family protein [Campylobacterota bacterium]
AIAKYTLPLFLHGGLRFGIVSGYELHFDLVWQEVMRKNVDVVLSATSSTFDSAKRWEELLKMRAMLNNVYILRANRVGSYKEEETWQFYGQSALISPYGEVEVSLGDKEEMIVATIDKDVLAEARKLWGWKKQVSKRENV